MPISSTPYFRRKSGKTQSTISGPFSNLGDFQRVINHTRGGKFYNFSFGGARLSKRLPISCVKCKKSNEIWPIYFTKGSYTITGPLPCNVNFM